MVLYEKVGIPVQEAFDMIDQHQKERFRAWYLVRAEVPQWGEVIDSQAQEYIRAVKLIALGNLNWS